MRENKIITEEYTDKKERSAKYPPSATFGKVREIDKDKNAAMCMLITVVSFLGYLVENIFTGITAGRMDNRNMFLPFLFGYGISIFVIYLLFGTPAAPKFGKYDLSAKSRFLNTLVYFGMAFSIVCIGECILGTAVEMTTGIIWWDYRGIPMNITKYTSVPTSAAFAGLITLFMGCIFKPLYNAFLKMDKKLLHRLATVFMVAMTVDFIHSGLVMMSTGKIMEIWKINF